LKKKEKEWVKNFNISENNIINVEATKGEMFILKINK